MSTKIQFGNKTIQLPGTYARIVAGQTNPPRNLDYGRILIIDNSKLNATKTGKGILGGAGINGTLASGKAAIYELNDIKQFREFVGGEWWWKAAEGLFNPDGRSNGISMAYVVKPATTVPASITFAATGGGAAGGTLKLKFKDESTQANGVLSSTKLASGYSYTIEVAPNDATKWVMKIWRGNKKELYTDGLPYSEDAAAYVPKATLIAESPAFNNMATLIAWADTDAQLGKYCVKDATSAIVGLGTVTAGDIASISGHIVAAGATATYDSLDDIFEFIKDLDYSAILTTCSTADPSFDSDILKIVDHLVNTAKFDKTLFVAGHNDTIATSIGYATTANSPKFHVVHGSHLKKSNLTASKFRTWESFFTTAYAVGRLFGLRPENPLTYKDILIDGLVNPLSEQQRTDADEAGVLCFYYDDDFGKFVCLHDVNTLQDNEFVLTNTGESHLIQVERIKSQLNKELIINSKKDLMSNPDGLNRFNLTEEDCVVWTKNYLMRRVGTLLVGYRNVTAETVQDVIMVSYEASPNSEIKGLFFTGYLYL